MSKYLGYLRKVFNLFFGLDFLASSYTVAFIRFFTNMLILWRFGKAIVTTVTKASQSVIVGMLVYALIYLYGMLYFYAFMCSISTLLLEKHTKKRRVSLDYCKQMNMAEIVKTVSENDIVELEILKKRKIIAIGASSDCEQDGFGFFDKKYYIAKTEYDTAVQFEEALHALFPDGNVPVFTIDGVKCVKRRKKQKK